MINVAVLGCGSIAHTMSRTLRAMAQQGAPLCLYAAASRDLARAEAFCREEGFARAYGSYEEMAADPAVDLVYVASPHSHHAEHMKLCIGHGKAILCEKSFTANAKQAKEVLALAKEKHVLVAEAIWPRYMPFRRIVSDLIASGVIGEPRMLMANLHYPIEQVPRIRKPELAGGALLDVGVYPLNFAAMFFGSDPVRIESTVQLLETGVDRQENVSLYYADGRAAHITAGIGCRSDRHCIISGTKGYIAVDHVHNPGRIEYFLEEDDFTAAHPVEIPVQMTGYEYEVNACIRALEKGEIECSEMPHSEIIRVMEIMDELRAQWGVKFPFED